MHAPRLVVVESETDLSKDVRLHARNIHGASLLLLADSDTQHVYTDASMRTTQKKEVRDKKRTSSLSEWPVKVALSWIRVHGVRNAIHRNAGSHWLATLAHDAPHTGVHHLNVGDHAFKIGLQR